MQSYGWFSGAPVVRGLALICASQLATAQSPTWQLLSPPVALERHAMVHDTAAGLTVLFGGRANNSRLVSDTWLFDGARWRHVGVTSGPSAREWHAMAYDSQRAKVVLFGGLDENGALLADTWEFDVAQRTWTQVQTAGPSPRYAHGMVYDAARQVVVLVGGRSGLRLEQDTWHYGGVLQTWTQQTGAGSPGARMCFGLAYDAVRAVTVLFGGLKAAGRAADTWEYAGASWQQRTPPKSPPARMNHALACGASGGAVLLFGGFGDAGPLGDTWLYDGSLSPPTWTQQSPPASPPARYTYGLCHDEGLNCAVLYGGTDGTRLDDTWLFAGGSWQQVEMPGPQPGLNEAPRISYDALHGRVVMFGGVRGSLSNGTCISFDETWELTGNTWVQIPVLPSARPPARAYHAQAFDAWNGVTVIFGGWSRVGATSRPLFDTWEYDSGRQTWTYLPNAGGPNALVYAMAYDARRRTLVAFGGYNGTTVNNETWEYDCASRTWSLIPIASASPSPRMVAAIAYDAGRDRVVLFGGVHVTASYAQTCFGDTWEYDGSSRTWTQVPATGSPSPRYGSTMVQDPTTGRMVVCGGYDCSTYPAETWEYDGAARRWTQQPIPGPGERNFFPMTWDWAGTRIVGYRGSYSGQAWRGDLWEYRPAAAATWARYGSGCPGSNGVPSLDAARGSLPALGGTFQLDVTNLPAAPGNLAVLAGIEFGQLGGAPLPLRLGSFGLTGCDLWVGFFPPLVGFWPHPGGAVSLPYTIPINPGLAGLRLGMQALVLDPAAPNGVGALSNAGIATIQ